MELINNDDDSTAIFSSASPNPLVFASSWLIIRPLTNMRGEKKHKANIYARWSRYYEYIARAGWESRVASPSPVIRSPPTSVCGDINSCASECIYNTWTCSHSYVGVSSRRRRRKQSEEVGKGQWRNRGRMECIQHNLDSSLQELSYTSICCSYILSQAFSQMGL